MRIVSIQVDGFGSLRDRQLQTDSPLAVFYGANEAGKSTLMGFVRAVLFGFPTRASRSERYEPLGGGSHGGALTLIDEQGQRIRVERYDAPATGGKRASAGLVKVTLEDGTTGGEDLLNTLLGGLSADLYRSLFAFGLTELQELRTLQTDELSGYLYSAGLGVSGSAIMEAERALTAQADGLYRPRGRNQEMNRLLKELEGLELSLRRSRDGAANYDRLREERRAAEASAAALEAQQEALRAELQRLGLAGKARSSWLRLRQIGRELESLQARPGFPEQAAARLAALEAEQERLHAERDKLQLRVERLQGELAAIRVEPELLTHQVKLNHWLEQASTYEEYKKQIEQLQVELTHQRAQIDQLLSKLDVQWDETDITSFAITISLREQVRAFKEKFRVSTERELRIQSELESLQGQVSRAQEIVEGLETACKGLPFDVRAADSDPIALLQKLASDYSRWQLLGSQVAHQQELDAEQKHFLEGLEEAAKAGKASSRQLRQRMMMLMLLLAVIVPVILGWQGNLVAAAGALLIFAGAASFVWLNGRKVETNRASRAMSPAPVQDQRIESELKQLERKIEEQILQVQEVQLSFQQAAASTSMVAGKHQRSTFSQVSLHALQPYLDTWFREAELSKHQLSEAKRKLEKLDDTREAWLLLKQQQEQRARSAEAVQGESDQVRADWATWLQELGIGAYLSTDALMETIQIIEQAQERIRQLQNIAARRDMLTQNVTDFERNVSQLLSLPDSYHDHLFALKRWKEDEQEQLLQIAAANQLEQLCGEAEEAMRLLQQQSDRTEVRLRQLLDEGSALNGEQLRVLEREQAERAKLLGESRLLESSLDSMLSRGSRDSFIVLMEAHGEEELAQQADNLQKKLTDTISQANELREIIGKLTGQIELLEQGAEAANQRMQAESIRTTLDQQVNQYAIASFAALLMKKARDVYEQQRQPGVLLRASAYFSSMTNGAFLAVKAPFGEQRLLAVRQNGQTVDTNQLSRGTAEQLYLAMRFALAEEYAGKAILPLVLDDILVNFDEERMESCLHVLAELSSRHQVLLFTCHGHVRDAAARVIPDHLFIQL